MQSNNDIVSEYPEGMPVTAASDDPSRRNINNRYKIVRILGKGGMGTVFLAEDLLHERLRTTVRISSNTGGLKMWNFFKVQ